ncbi:hypothetical protein A2U01_0041705, partial [Trifolium medium]|nr:hypothetical protein [Trifolium medium]
SLWRVASFSSEATGVLSGRCASRRLIWRGAQLKFKSDVHNDYLRVAQGRWRGAPAEGYEKITACQDGSGVYKRITNWTMFQHIDWHLTMPKG